MGSPEETEQFQASEEATNQPKYDRSIIEGPLSSAIWKLAAPTILTNIFGGIQGLVDHIIVGNIVGYKGNAAIGVSWQIFLVVVVFVSSVFTGMSIMVARFIGAAESDKVNRTVYQGFITAIFIGLAVIAPVGYFAAPLLLDVVNAEAGVQAEALPYLRIMFLFSIGMMIFFMLSGVLRAAGDAKTPMLMGVSMTILNVVLNVTLIPLFGVMGSAIGTCLASGIVSAIALWQLWGDKLVVSFHSDGGYSPDFGVIKKLFQLGLPAGIQAIAMNIGGVLMLSFIGALEQSAAAQAAYAVGYTQLFALVSFASVGLMGATSAIVGQNLGAKKIERAKSSVSLAARYAFIGSVFIGIFFFFSGRQLLAIFGMSDPEVIEIGVLLLKFLALSGIFVSIALTYTGGLQATGDTKSPLYISIISQVIIPLGICFIFRHTYGLEPWHIWLAIVCGHACRCFMSIFRFNQGKWQKIEVDIETTKA